MQQDKILLLDANFLNPFVEGTLKTLKIQCGLDAIPGKFAVRSAQDPKPFACDIAGIVGIAGTNFNGSIAVCFPEKTFLGVIGKMVGETYDKMNPEVVDGAGEIMNIIYGAAKTSLNEKGFGLEKALPTVVSGTGLNVRSMGATPTLVLPFQTELGPFMIEVSVNIDKGDKNV